MRIACLGESQSILVRNCAEGLRAAGHEVHLISVHPHSEASPPAHVLAVPAPLYLPKFLVGGRLARRLLLRLGVEAVVAHYATSYGYLAVRAGVRPIVLFAQGSDILFGPARSRVRRFMASRALRRADLVLTVAEHLNEPCLRLGARPDTVRTFLRGIRTDIFRPRPEITRDPLHIVCTRHLHPLYNHALLLRAIPAVLTRFPGAHLTLCGAGPLERDLRRLSAALKMSGAVRFVGERSQEEVSALLNAASVYVSTSRSDGTSNSLLEAMACGAFPVVTDIVANRPWIADGENGSLVPLDDPAPLALRIIEALDNTALRARAADLNRRRIAQHCDTGRQMARLGTLLEELARRTRQRSS